MSASARGPGLALSLTPFPLSLLGLLVISHRPIDHLETIHQQRRLVGNPPGDGEKAGLIVAIRSQCYRYRPARRHLLPSQGAPDTLFQPG